MVLRENGIPCTATKIYWPKNNRKWERFLLTIRQRGVKVKNTVSFMYRLKGPCHFSRILYFSIFLAFYEFLNLETLAQRSQVCYAQKHVGEI